MFGLTFIFSLVINSGFNIDTYRRYQLTRAIWTQQPAVTQEDAQSRQVLIGANGNLSYWYGMGQSIFMLPGDIIAANLVSLLQMQQTQAGELLRQHLTTGLTFAPISALAITIGFLILIELGFALLYSALGALSLLFGTTFLYYTQQHQENSQILLLVLTGYYMHLRWLKQNRLLSLILGSATLGCLFIIRLTTAADVVGESVFVILVLCWHGFKSPGLKTKLVCFFASQAAGTFVFFLIDRLFQYGRFGDWNSNYLTVLVAQINAGIVDPTAYTDQLPLPANWPWIVPASEGIGGVLFSPEKSIFVYDLLLVVLLFGLLLRSFKPGDGNLLRFRSCYLIGGLVSLILYLIGYANVVFWGGDSAWGARYHTAPVHLLCLLAVPLFMEIRPRLVAGVRWLITTLIGLAIFTQVAGFTFASELELYQGSCGQGTNLRLLQRILNFFNYINGHLVIIQQCSKNGRTDWEVVPIFIPFHAQDYIPPQLQALTLLVWIFLLCFSLACFVIFLLFLRSQQKQNLL